MECRMCVLSAVETTKVQTFSENMICWLPLRYTIHSHWVAHAYMHINAHIYSVTDTFVSRRLCHTSNMISLHSNAIFIRVRVIISHDIFVNRHFLSFFFPLLCILTKTKVRAKLYAYMYGVPYHSQKHWNNASEIWWIVENSATQPKSAIQGYPIEHRQQKNCSAAMLVFQKIFFFSKFNRMHSEFHIKFCLKNHISIVGKLNGSPCSSLFSCENTVTMLNHIRKSTDEEMKGGGEKRGMEQEHEMKYKTCRSFGSNQLVFRRPTLPCYE